MPAVHFAILFAGYCGESVLFRLWPFVSEASESLFPEESAVPGIGQMPAQGPFFLFFESPALFPVPADFRSGKRHLSSVNFPKRSVSCSGCFPIAVPNGKVLLTASENAVLSAVFFRQTVSGCPVLSGKLFFHGEYCRIQGKAVLLSVLRPVWLTDYPGTVFLTSLFFQTVFLFQRFFQRFSDGNLCTVFPVLSYSAAKWRLFPAQSLPARDVLFGLLPREVLSAFPGCTSLCLFVSVNPLLSWPTAEGSVFFLLWPFALFLLVLFVGQLYPFCVPTEPVVPW